MKNPPPDALWRWVISADNAMKLLSQQPPCARTHACATTTCTQGLAEIAETGHACQDTRLSRRNASTHHRYFWMHNFDATHHNFRITLVDPLRQQGASIDDTRIGTVIGMARSLSVRD